VDLLDKARDDCAATIRERSPDIPADELAAAAAAMGYGAVKYADLRSHRATNYRFSFEEMLALKVRAVWGGGWVLERARF
jgi:arginyl-tRNA synthetase